MSKSIGSNRRQKMLSEIYNSGKQFVICCWCQKRWQITRVSKINRKGEFGPWYVCKATVEHLIPRSEGGSHHKSNLDWACGPCNHGRLTGNIVATNLSPKKREYHRQIAYNQEINKEIIETARNSAEEYLRGNKSYQDIQRRSFQ